MRYQMVLTASINPNGMFVKVTDGKMRQEQYLRAVRALLETASPLVDGITFIENTGADLAPFHELTRQSNRYNKNVEFISLSLNDYPRELGIGYGEFRLLDAGIAASKFLTPEHCIVKLTGRLVVRNLTSILVALPDEFDMVADVRPYKDPATGMCESRLMAFSYHFYCNQIVGMYGNVDGSKGIAAEHCLYQVVRNNPKARIIGRLPREPYWLGFSGSTGMRYDSIWMRMKYPAKVMARALARWANLPDLRPVWASANGLNVSQSKANSSSAVAN
jgi:hypothetical protein